MFVSHTVRVFITIPALIIIYTVRIRCADQLTADALLTLHAVLVGSMLVIIRIMAVSYCRFLLCSDKETR